MGLPMLLNALAMSSATLADTYVAGRLGSIELAAVGIGGQIWFALILAAVAIATGANSLVARFWGAQDLASAILAARHSLIAGIVFGAGAGLLGLCTCKPALQMLGAESAVVEAAWQYLRFNLLAHVPLTTIWVCHAIYRAKGDAIVPTIIMGIVTGLIVLLDFVFCLGPLKLGIAGIGLSWLVSSCLGCLACLFFLQRSNIRQCVEVSKDSPLTFSWTWFKRVMHIGLPVCVQDFSWNAGNFVLFWIFALTPYPTACQGAWAIGLRVEDIVAAMPVYALSMGVTSIVGQSLGAGKLDRAERAGWHAAGYGVILMFLCGALMFFGADWLAHQITDEPLMCKYAADYLRIVGLSEPFYGIWFVLFGALEGAGYTRVIMWTSILCLVVLRLPLAYLFTVLMGMGPAGSWISIALSNVAGCLMAIYFYARGKWKSTLI